MTQILGWIRFSYKAGNVLLGLFVFWAGVLGAAMMVLGLFSQVPGTEDITGPLLGAIADLVLDLAEPLAEALIENVCERIETLNCVEVLPCYGRLGKP